MRPFCPTCGNPIPADRIVFDEVGRTLRNGEFVERFTQGEAVIYARLLAARGRPVTVRELNDCLGAECQRVRAPGADTNSAPALMRRLREKLMPFEIRILAERGRASAGYRLQFPQLAREQAA